MVVSDTLTYRITKETKEELERIRKVISKELGIDVTKVKTRHAEAVLRIKANRGQIMVKEIQDVMLGKIK